MYFSDLVVLGVNRLPLLSAISAKTLQLHQRCKNAVSSELVMSLYEKRFVKSATTDALNSLKAVLKVDAVVVSVWWRWALWRPRSVQRSSAAIITVLGLRHALTEGQSFQRSLCFHEKYMQDQKGGYRVSQCWVRAQSQRYTAKYISVSEVMHVGVNTCVNVKMKATAVSTEALLYFSALLDVQ